MRAAPTPRRRCPRRRPAPGSAAPSAPAWAAGSGGAGAGVARASPGHRARPRASRRRCPARPPQPSPVGATGARPAGPRGVDRHGGQRLVVALVGRAARGSARRRARSIHDGHEVVEDLGGERAARHRPAGVLVLHRLDLVRVAHPDGHRSSPRCRPRTRRLRSSRSCPVLPQMYSSPTCAALPVPLVTTSESISCASSPTSAGRRAR